MQTRSLGMDLFMLVVFLAWVTQILHSCCLQTMDVTRERRGLFAVRINFKSYVHNSKLLEEYQTKSNTKRNNQNDQRSKK